MVLLSSLEEELLKFYGKQKQFLLFVRQSKTLKPKQPISVLRTLFISQDAIKKSTLVWEEILKYKWTFVPTQSLVDSMESSKQIDSKLLRPIIKFMKQMLDSKMINIVRWIDTEVCMADILTKPSRCALTAKVMDVLRTGNMMDWKSQKFSKINLEERKYFVGPNYSLLRIQYQNSSHGKTEACVSI